MFEICKEMRALSTNTVVYRTFVTNTYEIKINQQYLPKKKKGRHFEVGGNQYTIQTWYERENKAL